jgi:hypothetical protein
MQMEGARFSGSVSWSCIRADQFCASHDQFISDHDQLVAGRDQCIAGRPVVSFADPRDIWSPSAKEREISEEQGDPRTIKEIDFRSPDDEVAKVAPTSSGLDVETATAGTMICCEAEYCSRIFLSQSEYK